MLQGVELAVREGEFVAIIGPSGCGKSTLLHLLATLDAPDTGEIHFEGNRIDNLSTAGRDILRNRYFGMIFQFYHLLPELTTFENVLAPAMIGESVLGYWRRRAAITIGRVRCSKWLASAIASSTNRASYRAAKCSAPPSPARSSRSPRVLLGRRADRQPR